MSEKTNKAQSIRNSALALQVTALFAHIFCCGLPAFAAIASLLGAAGTRLVPLWAEDFFHAYEVPIFVFSAILVAVSIASHFWAERRARSCDDDHCHDHSHTPAHAHDRSRLSRMPWFLILAIMILALNAYLTFGFEHAH